MAIKFNIEPYWDDYNTPTTVDGLTPREKYNKILFRPGHALQARELTQIQSMLQNQVSSIGDHMFKEGSVVIPGSVYVNNKIDYLKVTTTVTNINDFIGLEISNGTSTAKVVYALDATDTDPVTLYVNYTSGSDKFADNDIITSGALSATVTSSGFGSIVSIDEGIYYIKKHFVIVKGDTVVLSKYTTGISYDVGLKINESVISSGHDTSLNDNAQGTPNESAPGAHRYSITTSLVKQDVYANTGVFVLLARIVDGIIVKHARETDYAVLEDTLARRTFDESGNYTVNPFPATAKPHIGGDDTKLTLGIEPSKAYVRGYEIETLNTTNVDLNKARESELAQDKTIPVSTSNYIDVTNMVGVPDITTFTPIELKDAGNNTIGTVKPRATQRTDQGFRIHVFDLTGTIAGATRMEFPSGNSTTYSADIDSIHLSSDKLVFELPESRIKTCSATIDPNDAPDYNYRFSTIKKIDVSIDVAGNNATFHTLGSGETLSSEDINDYILYSEDDGTIIDLSEVTMTVTYDNPSGAPYVIFSNIIGYEGVYIGCIGPITRTILHKTKTLVTESNYTMSGDFTSWQSLGHADIVKINSITNNGQDVTRHFDLDNGQRSSHYDTGAIKVKPESNYTVSGDLIVEYEYMQHSSGDFFTIDSYSSASIYEDIPSFEGIELRSAVDFRPKVGNTEDIGGGSTEYTAAGASVCNFPAPNTQFETDIQYYLNRVDKVYLDKNGEFGVLEGVSALEPKAPGIPKDAMVLYHLYVPAYTLNPEEVNIKFIDNRRYTMRDIGKLENRINNLEYYTTLSLLETDASQKQIINGMGNPRWKSGFMVDSFTSTNTARVASPEFKSCIDRETGTLRPLFSEGNANLIFNDTLSTAQKTGDLITLPYTNTTLITQTQSSSTINVNPYEVFNWTGTVTLSPSSDEWKDIDRRPQVIINNDGVYDAMLAIANESVATGTVWNSWQTNWTGSETDTNTTNWSAGWGRGRDITTTTTTTTNQIRTGVTTAIGQDTVTTNVGDRVVDVRFAPFMRSRFVSFEATRLRPNTQVYAFFDDIDVSSWVNEVDLDNLPTQLQAVVNTTTTVGINNQDENPLGVTTLTTNEFGELKGSFFIPNNIDINFATGDKTFVLTDSSTNASSDSGTFAAARYSAKGLIETKENVVISTRVPTIQRTNATDSRVITSTDSSTRRVTDVNWSDPLAQSFIVESGNDGGAFITSIELYFATKDSSVPVQVQVRKMDQGIPTQEVIPFADKTINPSNVNVDGNATTFTFDSPVYLQDGIEYCFVIMANSNEYTVKYAVIGEEDEEGNRISKQPYNGVMFKSQNASTWTPDQNADLMFKMNRALFDTSSTASIVLNNDTLPARSLPLDPFQTTNGSNDVIVTHYNHGMTTGENVTISNCTMDVNGIPASEFQDVIYSIKDVERNKYTITTTSNANSSAIGGGMSVTATENLQYNNIYPLIQELTLPSTGMTWGIKDNTLNAPNNYTMATGYNPIIVNNNFMPQYTKAILSGDTPTLYMNGILASTSDNVSPVVDLERCSAITVSNIINNPDGVGAEGHDMVTPFFEETDASQGSALSKYVTKTIQLETPSTSLKLYLDVNRPSYTGVQLYQKVGSEAATFDAQPWVPLSPDDGFVPYSDNMTDYSEIEYTYDNMEGFTLYAIKIVFTSQTTAKVPSVRNFRSIALV